MQLVLVFSTTGNPGHLDKRGSGQGLCFPTPCGSVDALWGQGAGSKVCEVTLDLGSKSQKLQVRPKICRIIVSDALQPKENAGCLLLVAVFCRYNSSS